MVIIRSASREGQQVENSGNVHNDNYLTYKFQEAALLAYLLTLFLLLLMTYSQYTHSSKDVKYFSTILYSI